MMTRLQHGGEPEAQPFSATTMLRLQRRCPASARAYASDCHTHDPLLARKPARLTAWGFRSAAFNSDDCRSAVHSGFRDQVAHAVREGGEADFLR